MDDLISPLILIRPRMSWYVTTFKNENNKLMSFSIDDDKLLQKYKTIWTEIEDLKNFEKNNLPVYDDRI